MPLLTYCISDGERQEGAQEPCSLCSFDRGVSRTRAAAHRRWQVRTPGWDSLRPCQVTDSSRAGCGCCVDGEGLGTEEAGLEGPHEAFPSAFLPMGTKMVCGTKEEPESP